MRPAAALCCVATVGLTAAACGGGGGSSGGTATGSVASGQANPTAYCNQARQVQQAEQAVAANPTSPDGLKSLFATFDKLAAVAPSEVHSSVQTLSAFYNRVLSALGSNSPSNQTAVSNAVNSAIRGQQTQVQAAGQKFLDYTKKTCNIDLSGSPSGSTTTTRP
ncbi:MAG TPA: hypothetical protein VH112_04260 [Acidimicrobiales bacterium]|nr:hypothetical protein [Acidimicrobiales bacterium]